MLRLMNDCRGSQLHVAWYPPLDVESGALPRRAFSRVNIPRWSAHGTGHTTLDHGLGTAVGWAPDRVGEHGGTRVEPAFGLFDEAQAQLLADGSFMHWRTRRTKLRMTTRTN